MKSIGSQGVLPVYGDYTIQCPTYSEAPQYANTSASVRYTYENYWVIMRGEGLRNPGGPGYSQYPANAQLLCEREEFCGSTFSSGDRYINDRALNPAKTGNASTWLQAGINHHITFVVRQIARYFES